MTVIFCARQLPKQHMTMRQSKPIDLPRTMACHITDLPALTDDQITNVFDKTDKVYLKTGHNKRLMDQPGNAETQQPSLHACVEKSIVNWNTWPAQHVCVALIASFFV